MQKFFITLDEFENRVLTKDTSFQLINVLRSKVDDQFLVGVIDKTYLMGKTTIDPDGKPGPGVTGVTSTLLTNNNWSRMLDVKGNALITGTLEATEKVASSNMDAGILRAGAQLEGNASYTSDVDWWLRVDANGIVSREKNNNGQSGKTRMMINDAVTELYGVEGDLWERSALILDGVDAQL